MKRRMLLAGLFLATGAAAMAQQAAPPELLAKIRDDDAVRIPRSLTPEERRTWQVPYGHAPAAPPTGSVRAWAEYEGTIGLLFRWGSFNSLLTSMIVPITTATPPSYAYVVVSGASQQSSASSTLSSAGANMAYVRFITASTNSVWIRDYGPRFIENNGHRAMVDHIYNRPRPQDDAFPGVLATQWSEPKFDLPLTHGGGNFHLFRNRDAFMTRLIMNENPGLTEQQVKDYFQDYNGLDLTLFDPFPSSYDATQHIDMWMFPIGDGRVIVGQYAPSEGGGIPASVSDGAATTLQGRGYTVYRTPGWNSGGTHYTYVNAAVLNQLTLVCQFTGYSTQNAQAISVFQAAMPGQTIVPIDCTDIIGYAGSLHCIVMHVSDILFHSGFDE